MRKPCGIHQSSCQTYISQFPFLNFKNPTNTKPNLKVSVYCSLHNNLFSTMASRKHQYNSIFLEEPERLNSADISLPGIRSSLDSTEVVKKPRKVKVNLMQEMAKNMENSRLLKRLYEINNRKKTQSTSIDYCTLNMKSREAHRLKDKKRIQEENDQLVVRIVTRLSSYKKNPCLLPPILN